MALTFGASTSDYVAFIPIETALNSNSIWLVTGWYYATTLGTNDRYWSTFSYARVPTTTANLNVAVQRATTDDSATFTSVLVANVWQFLAVLIVMDGTSNAGTVRLWVGGETDPPIMYSDTTSGSGAVTAGSTIFTGAFDAGVNPFSFTGDIADVTYLYSEVNGNNGFFGMDPSDAKTTAGVSYIGSKFVVPLWRGDYDSVIGFGRERHGEADGLIAHVPFINASARVFGRVGSTPTQNPLVTVSGPTLAARGNPRPWTAGDRYHTVAVSRSRGRR